MRWVLAYSLTSSTCSYDAWKASRRASIISRSFSANFPSAQATLTSDLTMAMSCECMAGMVAGAPGRVKTLLAVEEGLASDPRRDVTVPTYEATLGGPILKDKLWFFGAARLADNKTSETSVFTNIVYDNGVNDK